MPAGGGTPHAVMPAFPYEVLNASWDPDGKSIWMVVNMGVHSELFQVDLATRKPRQVTSGEHSIVAPFWNISGGHQVFMVEEPTRIDEVWTLAPGASTPMRITGITDYLDRDFALPRQERIEWKGADGVTIEGILTYPIDYKAGTRYPLVVQLHGGPEDSDKFGPGTIFLTYQPALAAQGLCDAAAELSRELRLRQRLVSRACRRLFQEQPSRRARRRRSGHRDGRGRSRSPGGHRRERRRAPGQQADHLHHALQSGLVIRGRVRLDLAVRRDGYARRSRPLAGRHAVAEERAD